MAIDVRGYYLVTARLLPSYCHVTGVFVSYSPTSFCWSILSSFFLLTYFYFCYGGLLFFLFPFLFLFAYRLASSFLVILFISTIVCFVVILLEVYDWSEMLDCFCLFLPFLRFFRDSLYIDFFV